MTDEDERFDLSRTLADGREYLRRLAHTTKGGKCPCCGQKVKMYKRTISATTARGLVTAYAEAKFDWFNMPTLLPFTNQSDVRKLRHCHWELLEAANVNERDPNGPGVGTWRVTEAGRLWLLGFTTVPRRLYMFNNTCFGPVDNDIIHISQVQKFDYDDLIGRYPHLDDERHR